MLKKANDEFTILIKRSGCRSKFFKTLDLTFKVILALAGALLTYSSDEKNTFGYNFIKAMGIIIAGLTAISSVFTFEKRAHANSQIYSKCKSLIPELEEKILNISELKPDESDDTDNVKDYIKNIFIELNRISLISFTDSSYGKIEDSVKES